MCLFICLSLLRSREWDVVVLCFLHQREELHLASCTNCFSSRYNTLLERKRLWKFFRGYALTRPYTSVKISGYNGHDQSCLWNSRRFGVWVTRPSCVKPKTYSFVNGLVPCTYPTQNQPVHSYDGHDWSCLQNFTRFGIDGHALHVSKSTCLWTVLFSICIIIILVFCVSVCLFVLSEISWTGYRNAALPTPTWRASPGKLHKPLLEAIQCIVREKKALEVFPRLRVDGRIPT